MTTTPPDLDLTALMEIAERATNDADDLPYEDWVENQQRFRDAWPPDTALAILTRLVAAEARAERAEARVAVLEGALETFAIMANEDTDYLPDEHIIALTYDDSALDDELGGPNTLLGERFMRAFRAARQALASASGEGS